MKKALYISMASLMIASVASSQITKPYASYGIGAGTINDASVEEAGIESSEFTFDGGVNIESAVGCGFEGMPIRVELALAHQKNDLDQFNDKTGLLLSGSAKGDLAILSFMANGYWDIETDTPVTPYFLAGIGFINADLDIEDSDVTNASSGDDTVFAGTIGVGVGYEVSENLIIDLKYKYLMAQDFEDTLDGDKVKIEVAGHMFQIGARCQF